VSPYLTALWFARLPPGSAKKADQQPAAIEKAVCNAVLRIIRCKVLKFQTSVFNIHSSL